MYSSQDVKDVLLNWKDHQWQMQGFGMLRTYLPGEGEPRLQIWDQRLAQPGNNTVHDHPWNFESHIYAGVLWNQRYFIDRRHSFHGQMWEEHFITPGVGGGLTEKKSHPVRLAPQQLEMYAKDEGYGQTWSELHLSRYLNGTVTLITRERARPSDSASSFSNGRVPWSFFEPRPATQEEILRTITYSLLEWW